MKVEQKLSIENKKKFSKGYAQLFHTFSENGDVSV